MSEVVCANAQEGYEDDFEKDLDWLICEESRSEDQGPDYEDIEAEIDKELEESEKEWGTKESKKSQQGEKRRKEKEGTDEEDERWPSPMEPLECELDRDSSFGSPPAVSPPVLDDQSEEENKYIFEKIQQANRDLRDQEAPDVTRHRRLHFKETLVDLVVPPLGHQQTTAPCSAEMEPRVGDVETGGEAEAEGDLSGKLSELNISPQRDSGGEGSSRASESVREGAGVEVGKSNHGGQGSKEGKVLVEKDGKFDLVSLKEVESHGLLPPLAKNYRDSRYSPRLQEVSFSLNKTQGSSSSPCPFSSSALSHQYQSIEHLMAPKPPSQPRNRPSSASRSQRGSQKQGGKRRVQSATGSPSQATYTLSPKQKGLLQKIQDRRERLAREAEQRKHEEEEQKRQENELAFRAWLMKKREQLRDEQRIHRAQEMELQNSRNMPVKKATGDREEAFRLWLRRKREQLHRERELEEMRKLEQESAYILHNREECEQAFKLWLRQKRAEKLAEKQAVRERSRRLVLEVRRARRMQDLLCSVNEAKPFRFTEHLSYRF